MGYPLKKSEVVGAVVRPSSPASIAKPVPSDGRLASAVLAPATGPNLSADDQIAAERRFAIIEPLISPNKFVLLWFECGNKKGAVVERVSKDHNVKRSTIYNWLKAFNAGGLPALVNKDRNDKGISRSFKKAAMEFFLAAAMPKHGEYGALSVREIYRVYNEERVWRDAHVGKRLSQLQAEKYARYLDEDRRLKAEARLSEASYATFVRWFNRIPATIRVMSRNGGEDYSKTQEILSFRSLSTLKPLDYVVMDHRQLDLFCLVPARDGGHAGWKLARPWLTAAIDMRTRKWLAWAIVESPSSDSIASVLKKTFLEHGLPSALYWDNGKDFTCEWFEGKTRRRAATFRVPELHEGIRGVLETLNVRVHHAIVRRARSKIIEPNFVNTANFDRSLPTWCGHKPTARPERFGELLDQHERWLRGEVKETVFKPISEIAWLYDEFLRTLNERDHTGEGMQKFTPTGRGWMCPNECWERLIGSVTRRWAPPDVIQFCFRKRRENTVRNGDVKVTFLGRDYHYRIAGKPTRLMALNGQKVELGYDPYDMGTVAIYHAGCFIGLAENLELRKMGEQEFVQDERERRAARRDVRQLIREVHSVVPVPTAEERAFRRIEVAPSRREPQRATVACEIPENIAAAIEAVRNDRDVKVEARQVEVVRAVEVDDDAEFNFFS